MKIDIVSLFPEVISPYLEESILFRAQQNGQTAINVHNLRDFTNNKHRKVDDTPFVGSPGMVIQVEPVSRALEVLRTHSSKVILFSPKGSALTMPLLHQLLLCDHLILLAGHYEGFDHRVESYVDQLISIGDFVVTGGELPALILTDALVRLVPNVLGNEISFQEDSFYKGLLDWDSFTRPQNFDILGVPAVLTCGNHKEILAWKKRNALINTFRYRPDLLATCSLSDGEKTLLSSYFLEEEINE